MTDVEQNELAAKLAGVEITPRPAHAYVPLSRCLLDASDVSLEDLLARDVGSAISEVSTLSGDKR